jgi:hypothetical protein
LTLALIMVGTSAPVALAQKPNLRAAATPAGVGSGPNSMVLANDILNRWEPVAIEAGVHSSSWREILALQLTRMSPETLSGLDMMAMREGNAKATYAVFAQGVRVALMRTYMERTSGKGPMKPTGLVVDWGRLEIAAC